MHSGQRARGEAFREKAIGIYLEVEGEPLIVSKQQ